MPLKSIPKLVWLLTFACGCCNESLDPELNAWSTIENPNADIEDVRKAVESLPSREHARKPEAWTALINNPKYSSSHRSILFFEFFKRYITGPIPFSDIIAIPGTREWFTEQNLHVATYDAALPPFVLRSPYNTHDIFMLQPEFLAKRHEGLYLVFSSKVPWQQLVDPIKPGTNTSSIILLYAVQG